jgi:hypothetical protein
MILVPFPDLQKSLDYFPHPTLMFQFTYWLPGVLRGDWYSEKTRMWKYHHHFVCEYGLMGLEIVITKAFKPWDYAHIKRELQQRMSKLAPTGKPEWWGDETIHGSHKECIDESPPSPGKMRHDLLVYPEVDLNVRLSKLQPIIREFHS